jgi:hypothetical protein
MHGPTCIFWANLTPFSPQRWFTLGDALPMHWDYDIAAFATGRMHKTRPALQLQSNIFLNDRKEDGGAPFESTTPHCSAIMVEKLVGAMQGQRV